MRLFQEFEPFLIHTLRPRLVAVGGTARALRCNGLFRAYDGLEALSAGSQGGFVQLADRVVERPATGRDVSHVIYLIDPLDPTSLYPETLAIKRECVVKRKFFASTYGAAHEWLTLLWLTAEAEARLALVANYFVGTGSDASRNAVALIAHDSKKEDMLDFVIEHYPLLDSFPERLSTGTTGAMLNGEVPARLEAEWSELLAQKSLYDAAGVVSNAVDAAIARMESLRNKITTLKNLLIKGGRQGDWVNALQTGREGGDVQVAARIVGGHHSKRCKRVFFLRTHSSVASTKRTSKYSNARREFLRSSPHAITIGSQPVNGRKGERESAGNDAVSSESLKSDTEYTVFLLRSHPPTIHTMCGTPWSLRRRGSFSVRLFTWPVGVLRRGRPYGSESHGATRCDRLSNR